jgi:hypothetical protein
LSGRYQVPIGNYPAVVLESFNENPGCNRKRPQGRPDDGHNGCKNIHTLLRATIARTITGPTPSREAEIHRNGCEERA